MLALGLVDPNGADPWAGLLGLDSSLWSVAVYYIEQGNGNVQLQQVIHQRYDDGHTKLW
jgi:hypothetical protein